MPLTVEKYSNVFILGSLNWNCMSHIQLQARITMRRDVGKRNLHEALKRQEGHTGVDDYSHEMACFSLKEQKNCKLLFLIDFFF